jgi:nucleoside phosphorylase
MPGRRGHFPIAMVTIIDEEREAARAVFSPTTRIPGTPFHTASVLAPNDIIISQSAGRGNVPANQAARDVIEAFRPTFVFVVGIAGAVEGRDDMRIGDVVVPNFVHYGEFEKRAQKKVERRYTPYDHPSLYLHKGFVIGVQESSAWHRDLEGLTLKHSDPKVHVGSLIAMEKS